MDPEQYKLIQQAVSEGIAATTWLLLLTSLIASGLGAYLGSYLKKKGENVATREDFDEFLCQLKKQTEAIEEIKEKSAISIETLKAEFTEDLERVRASIQSDVQKNLEGFKDSLERGRSFSTFSRERISGHLDRIISSMKEIGSVSDLAGMRSWANSGELLPTERIMFSELRSIKVNTGILLILRAIPQQTHDKVLGASDSVWHAWTSLIGQLTIKNPDFRIEFPDQPEFSPPRYQGGWESLRANVNKLEEAILEVMPSVLIPK